MHTRHVIESFQRIYDYDLVRIVYLQYNMTTMSDSSYKEGTIPSD